MEEKLQAIIENIKSITTQDMLGNYSKLNNPKKALAKDIEELEKALKKAQVFDILVSKNIDWVCLKSFDDVELYNFAKSKKIEDLTQEEFAFLKGEEIVWKKKN